jgi:hypothetical protein
LVSTKPAKLPSFALLPFGIVGSSRLIDDPYSFRTRCFNIRGKISGEEERSTTSGRKKEVLGIEHPPH